MNVSADLELLRASSLLESDPAAAARRAAALLADHPGHDAANLLFAAACRRLGNASEAIGLLESLARAQPRSALMQLELGRTYAAAGRSVDATAAFECAVKLDAALADAWRELSGQRLAAGDDPGADRAYAAYCRLIPDPPELADALASFNAQRLEAAAAAVELRLREAPRDVAALRLMASIHARRGDEAAAQASLNQALAISPCEAAAREHLVRLLIGQGRSEAALPHLERLLAAAPEDHGLLILHAEALRMAQRHTEGLATILRLTRDHPEDPDFWLIAGNQQRFAGRPEEAIQSYRRALSLRRGDGLSYLALSNLKTFRFTAQDIVDLRQALADPKSSATNSTYLGFALGKALEDEGEFADSFAHYARANAGARSGFDYDAGATTAFVRRFKAIFTAGFFAERRAWGSNAEDPIFIVGLPRSGSTLLEQILATHSQVEGTRELAEIPAIARELASASASTADRYPENIAGFGKARFDALAERYLDATRSQRPLARPRFVDKMLGNFVSIGLIQLMFPRATIIDSRRHPQACGFACYRQLFNPGMNFAYDLREIGLYYRDYADLMAHVDAVLPGRVHRVHYESLVADPETEVRRLLDHCRLPFEAGCLRFHENARVAQTLSSEQVRRPIYAEAVDQWRNFEPWLGPLRAALDTPA